MVFNTLVWERYDTSVIDCYKLIFSKRNIYKELKNDIGIFVGKAFFKLWAKTVKIFKSGDSYVVVETKNNDGLHFCTTEIYVPQEYFRMCYIRRQLMFCCDHVVDDVRGWHMTSWKLEFIILIVREECGSIKVKVYRKPTHTDQYLHFNSHHPLEHKLSVVRTLTHRAQSVVTDERDRKEEITHVKKALKNCGYGEWTFLRAQSKNKKPTASTEADIEKKSFSVTLPFVEGVSEQVRHLQQTVGCWRCLGTSETSF